MIEAILFAMDNSNEMVNIFNIGSEDTINAAEIGEIIVKEMGLEDVEFNYTGGSRGWKGDVPRMMLSIDRIKSLGWKPVHNSENSVRDAARSLLNNG
jgi:UDP-glucose 4-epimerase